MTTTQMPHTLRLRDLAMVGLIVMLTCGPSGASAQGAKPNGVPTSVAPTNDAPNPYRTVEGWAKLPEGRTWGATSAVAIDKDGESVWVGERCAANLCTGSPLDPILKFDRTGKLVRSFGAGLVHWPHGITVDREGNVWVTDGRGAEGSGHQVLKFSPEGELLMRLGAPGGARAGAAGAGASASGAGAVDFFWQPNDVLVAPSGDIFVVEGHSSTATANARVLKFDRTGKFLKAWGKKGTAIGEFDQPHALAMDSRGRLFVGDRGNNRLQIFDQEGTFLESWTQFSRASGLFIDANDMIYVADSESGSIDPSRPEWKRGIRIGSARTGEVTAFIPDPVETTRNTSAAEGVAVDAKGVIYGAEVGPRAFKRYERKSAASTGGMTIPVGASELRDSVMLFTNDRAALMRRWNVEYSTARRARFTAFYQDWRARLTRMDFDRMSQEGKIDYILLDTRLRSDLDQLRREDKLASDMKPLVPFADVITEFDEARRRFDEVDGQLAGRKLADLATLVDSLTRLTRAKQAASITRADRIVGLRTVAFLGDLQGTLRNWHRFYSGYDPSFSWWTADPYRRMNEGMTRYTRAIREVIIGQREGAEEPIIGDPIGVEGVKADLDFEMIAYTPQELIAMAERDFKWIEAEQKKAAREMGFGDDWRAALEKVKQAYVEPGEQPKMVRGLAESAMAFITSRNLVTVPPLADEVWRMEMMSPRQQLVSPFFLGGEIIQVAYPTDSMTHDDKLMSMRGNNPHFSLATVHHELIPGHHLQGFMTQRYNAHRQAFSTPFWGEGWALYWEMLLWDAGFPPTPEDRMGMLFWRSHRLARIIFSLRFHLGTMTPQEAVDFLVSRVGHERANAEAEVRRSFNGTYSPMYQAAYMLGGLQFRSLHAELVGSGRMTDRAFHDAVLQGGRMPIEMVRARLTGAPLMREYRAGWKFISP